jgi:hypothetical protein
LAATLGRLSGRQFSVIAKFSRPRRRLASADFSTSHSRHPFRFLN